MSYFEVKSKNKLIKKRELSITPFLFYKMWIIPTHLHAHHFR